MAFLIVFGGISFLRMGISQLPDVDFPVVSVSLSMEGAAPEVMESDIVDPVEDSVMSIEGVRTVTSTSQTGAARVVVEFELSRNIDLAMQDVQAKVSQVQRRLPKQMDPPVVSKTNPDDQPIVWLTLSSKTMPLRDLMIYTRDHLKDQFSTVSGVGDIGLGGYLEPNMRIWVSEKALSH
jgi:HAE1 family hydrophobic/amphiphilic exporter-1